MHTSNPSVRHQRYAPGDRHVTRALGPSAAECVKNLRTAPVPAYGRGSDASGGLPPNARQAGVRSDCEEDRERPADRCCTNCRSAVVVPVYAVESAVVRTTLRADSRGLPPPAARISDGRGRVSHARDRSSRLGQRSRSRHWSNRARGSRPEPRQRRFATQPGHRRCRRLPRMTFKHSIAIEESHLRVKSLASRISHNHLWVCCKASTSGTRSAPRRCSAPWRGSSKSTGVRPAVTVDGTREMG